MFDKILNEASEKCADLNGSDGADYVKDGLIYCGSAILQSNAEFRSEAVKQFDIVRVTAQKRNMNALAINSENSKNLTLYAVFVNPVYITLICINGHLKMIMAAVRLLFKRLKDSLTVGWK